MWFLLGLALVFRLAIAWGNYGFVAMDDYEEMLRLAVPAHQVAGARAGRVRGKILARVGGRGI